MKPLKLSPAQIAAIKRAGFKPLDGNCWVKFSDNKLYNNGEALGLVYKMETDMNRTEHLTWCKTRAIEYVNRGDAKNALASMFSDLNKHPDTENHAGTELGMMLKMTGQLDSVGEVRKFINGFN